MHGVFVLAVVVLLSSVIVLVSPSSVSVFSPATLLPQRPYSIISVHSSHSTFKRGSKKTKNTEKSNIFKMVNTSFAAKQSVYFPQEFVKSETELRVSEDLHS